MGSGKTTISKQIAQRLDLEHREMDELIVSRSGKQSINEIFSEVGEVGFRLLETQVASHCTGDNLIVSAGGGAVETPETMKYLITPTTRCLFLSCPFETIKDRVGGSLDRPLMKDKDRAHQLWVRRQALYKAYAHDTIEVGTLSIDQVVEQVIERLR